MKKGTNMKNKKHIRNPEEMFEMKERKEEYKKEFKLISIQESLIEMLGNYVRRTEEITREVQKEMFPKMKPEPRTFLYKDKNGRVQSGFVIQKGSESVMYFERLKNGEHILFEGFEMCFLSCSLEKTKELWNKGEIEELKSHFVGFHGRNHPKEDKEVINKIYESRNESDEIEIKDKDEYQKQDGITEVLVERTTTKKGKNV